MLSLILTLIVIGVLLWLVVTYIPMPDVFKKIIMAVVVICVVIWLLKEFGLWGRADDIKVPRIGLNSLPWHV